MRKRRGSHPGFDSNEIKALGLIPEQILLAALIFLTIEDYENGPGPGTTSGMSRSEKEKIWIRHSIWNTASHLFFGCADANCGGFGDEVKFARQLEYLNIDRDNFYDYLFERLGPMHPPKPVLTKAA